MEFGKVEDVGGIDWAFPADDPSNLKRLIADASLPTLYFGAPAWGSRHWVGKIYPEKTPSQDFLFHYSRSFNCIELNTTHYRIPDQKICTEWLSKVPPHFKFCPKVHKDISHSPHGLYDQALMGHWFNFLEKLEGYLGPCFIQFHEMFSYREKAHLFHFLEKWPAPFKLSLELRHPSWFQKGVVLPALGDYLHKKNIGLVITDVAGRRDVLHSTLSTSWTMVRLIGNNLHASDEERLENWGQRIKSWQELGLKEAYLFLHQPDDLMTIEFSKLAEAVFIKRAFSSVPHIREVNAGSFFEWIKN